MRQPIVAIDGPAGSGKSTVATLLAERAGLQCISSGAMYRAVALHALREGIAPTDRAHLTAVAAALAIRFAGERVFVNGEDVTAALREPAVGEMASTLATYPEVRAHLVAKQQAYGRDGGIVMEGRDIQTVVFPEAEIKVFLEASAAERARRRWQELLARGEAVTYEVVLEEVVARDRRDTEREASPLRPATDAICVDTDGQTVAHVVDCLLSIVDTWRAHPDLRGAALARAAGCGTGAS